MDRYAFPSSPVYTNIHWIGSRTILTTWPHICTVIMLHVMQNRPLIHHNLEELSNTPHTYSTPVSCTHFLGGLLAVAAISKVNQKTLSPFISLSQIKPNLSLYPSLYKYL